MLFGVKLGTRSSRPSTKLNFYYRDGKYYFMVGKDLDIAAEIVGVESDDEGNRVVTVHRKRCLRRKNRAYGCKCGQRKQHADNRMQILQSQMSFPRRTAERNLTALPKFYQI